jgi:uncharacterized membrane protein
MTLLRTSTLMGATLTMGLVTGAFALYAHAIMPGLPQDRRPHVRRCLPADGPGHHHPWFMITAFGGAFVLTLVAGIANRGTPALPWIAAAFGLYLVAVVITVAVNVPMNDAIKAAGDPAHIDVDAGPRPVQRGPAGPPGTSSASPPASRPSACSPGPSCLCGRVTA